MIIDLHSHTFRSFDAFTTDEDLIFACKMKGIDVIGITEHDKYASLDWGKFERAGITALRGREFTTADGVHIIGFFPINADLTAPPIDKKEILAFVRKNGGVLIMPHPLKTETGYLAVYGEDEDVAQFNYLELLNGGDAVNFGSPIIQALARRLSIGLISSSDSHAAEQVGACVTRVIGGRTALQHDEIIRLLSDPSHLNFELLFDKGMLSKGYRKVPAIKRSAAYQYVLSLIPTKVRRFIKLTKNRLFKNKKGILPPIWSTYAIYSDKKFKVLSLD